MNGARFVVPQAERTYALSGWQKFAMVLGAVAPLAMATLLLWVFTGERAATQQTEGSFVLLLGVLMLVVSLFGIPEALRIPRSAIRVTPEGLAEGPPEGATRIPWAAIRGANRREWRMLTQLTDAQGQVVATVNDRISDAQGCLDVIADAAHLDTPELPASYALRGVPMSFALLLAVLGTMGLLVTLGRLDLMVMIISVVMAALFGFLATHEVTGVAIEESGVTVRRLLQTEVFGWDEISYCGFRLVTMRDNRWVEAVLETSRGTRKLAPLGAPGLPMVALIRARIRQGRPTA